MTRPALTEAEMAKLIREENARYFAKERQRDARLLRNYQADCLASWGEKA